MCSLGYLKLTIALYLQRLFSWPLSCDIFSFEASLKSPKQHPWRPTLWLLRCAQLSCNQMSFRGTRSATGYRFAPVNAHVRYLYGSGTFSFVVSFRLNNAALVWASPGVLAKMKFFREITNGLMLPSARLLLSSISHPQETPSMSATLTISI